MKYLYILLGFLSLFLGGLGILLPGLPTTPFVLLAAGLFLRSSETLYEKLRNNRIFGPYLRRYMEQKGMTVREKITAISMMWVMIIIAMVTIDSRIMHIIFPMLACIGTLVVGFTVNTVSPLEEEDAIDDEESSDS